MKSYQKPLLPLVIFGSIVAAFIIFPMVRVLQVLFTLAVFGFGAARLLERRTIRRFAEKWGPQGKDLLLVYSNSPHWQEYIETRWLPLLQDRAVVLNWSERARWNELHRLEAAVVGIVGGSEEFNPIAIVIRRGEPVQKVRFWQAFRDYKHGKDRALREAERELGKLLGVVFPAERLGS